MSTRRHRFATGLSVVAVLMLVAVSCGRGEPVGSTSHPTHNGYRSWGAIDRAHPSLNRDITHAFGNRFGGIVMDTEAVPTVRRVYVVGLTDTDRTTLDALARDVAHRYTLLNARYSRRELNHFRCIASGAIPERFADYSAMRWVTRSALKIDVIGSGDEIHDGLIEAGLPEDSFFIDAHPQVTPVPGMGKAGSGYQYSTFGRECIWPPPRRGQQQGSSPTPRTTST